MEWNFENDRPIYIQLVEKLKLAIVAGEYPAGERLPSVRDLAIEIKANPNTVQRALVDLEQTGLIYTERTNGKFVTEDKELVQEIREKLQENDGYCPCKIEKTDDTKCMCKEFREQESGECHCGLYVKE